MSSTVATAGSVLAEPLRVGELTTRNRIWMAPMSVCYADDSGYVTDAEVEHYGRRAQGGAAVVVTENAAISDSGRQLPRQTMVSDDRFVPGLRRIAAAIRIHGAVSILQIVHAGRYAGPWDVYEKQRRLAPSSVSFPLLPGRVVTPQEITRSEIDKAIDDFAAAADRATRAGFDGIEIHGAQGFLISQFLSPRMNHRTDQWGGPYENRARFALRVVDAVRAAVPARTLVGFHLLVRELLPGGFTPDDARRLAVDLESRGVDFIIPATATFEDLHSHRDAVSLPRFQMPDVRDIAAAVQIPVIANGALGEPEDVARIVAGGEADAVALARPMLVDPDWAAKVIDGRSDNLRLCPCRPPQCIQTQLKGASCHSWPAAALERGYLGYED